MDFFTQDIQFIPGVGPKRAELFKKELNIRTAEDLLRHYPYKYVDRSRFYMISEISENMPFIQLKGKILKFEKVGEGCSQRLIGVFTDGRQYIELVWFKGLKFVAERYKTNIEYVVFGKPTLFNGKYNIVHPDIEILSQLPPVEQMGLQPFYNTSEKMKTHFLNSKAIQKIIYSLLPTLQNGIPETLPAYILNRYGLLLLV